MKIATISSVCVTFVAIGRLGESRKTVPNMIGAKIAPRLKRSLPRRRLRIARAIALARASRFSAALVRVVDLVPSSSTQT